MTYNEAVTTLNTLTDEFIARIGGQLTSENMNQLSIDEHCLLAYRYLRDEVMDGGFIQLIQNGYGPYVLLGPFPMILKKEWGMKQFGQFLFDVAREYKKHREELEADKSDDDFMAQYEQYETLNDYGDDYLDDYEEVVTPQIVEHYQSITTK
ncbi:MAG: DMP19 family protein [Bacteroidaceae bacterium]|nr:DMP19 family protein [Bacteroidaceae bacterium]